MNRRATLFLGLLFLAVPFITTTAATDDFEYGTRKHLDTVALTIKGIPRDAGSWNIIRKALKTELVDRLSAAGIRVIDPAELPHHPEADIITLQLTLNRGPYYFYLYGLNMVVRNRLALSPQNSGSTTIKTWSETRNGMLMPGELGNILNMSHQLLDHLLKERSKG